MFSQQLIAELVPSLVNSEDLPSLNDGAVMRRLLEKHTGYAQFRVVLPGTVTFSPGASRMRGEGQLEVTLQHAVLAYVPEDRPRVVELIAESIQTKQGFHFMGRRMVGDKARVIETIADVVVENGAVTEVVGYSRDVSDKLEKEAMSISRARLIRRMVEDMPVPVVVLDRGLRVVACSAAWATSHGLVERDDALGQPINKLIEVSQQVTSAIIDAMNGKTAQFEQSFYSAEDGLAVPRRVVVTSWQCGSDAAGGVLMMAGEEHPPYATLEVADRAFGRRTRNLIEMLETVEPV